VGMSRGLAFTPVNTYGRMSPLGVLGGLALTYGILLPQKRLFVLHAVE
jgi:hypothetical protein